MRRLLFITFLLLTINTVNATVIFNVASDGTLLGASGINVGGTLYNVTFEDGTCDSLFNNCTSSTFSDITVATAAAQALLDTVFIDTSIYSFDSHPELTNGCSAPDTCQVVTPYSMSSAGFYGTSANNNYGSAADVISGAWAGHAYDFSSTNITVAVWSSSVPEPPTLFLMTGGLVAVFAVCRRRLVSHASI